MSLDHGIDLDQYRTQAKDLLKLARAADPAAIDRIRTHHPEHRRDLSPNPSPPERGVKDALRAELKLADAQLVIARELGYGSWAKLKEAVLFRQAVDLVDAGDVDGLATLLDANPGLVKARGESSDGYFSVPTLLHHVAGNPIRRPLPANIVDVARVLLDRGSDPNALCGVPASVSTIGLLLTSRQASEAGVAVLLVDLLRTAGAVDAVDLSDPAVLDDPIWNGGIETARELVRRGARMDLPQAAALGRMDEVRRLTEGGAVDAAEIEIALIYACVQNQVEAVRYLVLLGGRGDVIPPAGRRGGGQATALHNAALRGHEEIVRLLVDNGARVDVRDLEWNGMPADWAEHGGHVELASLLRGVG